MSSSNLKAYTPNQEMEGTAAADLSTPPGPIGLRDFAESVGIDLQQYIPFGVEIYISEPENMVSPVDRAKVSILAVETAVVGGTFDEIENYVNQKGILPFTRFRTQANLEDALKYLKRARITLLQRSVDNASFEEIQSIDL